MKKQTKKTKPREEFEEVYRGDNIMFSTSGTSDPFFSSNPFQN